MRDRLFKKFDKFRRHVYARKLFWVSISAAVFFWISSSGYLYRVIDRWGNGLAVLILTFLFLAFFVIDFRVQFRKQAIHNQPSWVFYLYWGIVNGLIIWSIINFLLAPGGYWWMGLVLALSAITIKWLNELLGPKIDLAFKRFAAGAVGLKDDQLGFGISAKNIAKGLVDLDGYVNVVALYGGLGFGKSSYARMILENFDCRRTLYTYISLTETNEARDFSMLFAERWLETLSGRYPKLDITSRLPFMRSILRETGNSFLTELLGMLSIFNPGLIRTKAEAMLFDKFYGKQKETFVSTTVGRLFGNIPEIKENLWIIMVDEVERAQFDEIYRLVEIIERFKNEGRSGLPVKLLFLLCISEPEFENYLNTYVVSEPRTRSLRTFFYEDPKSINHRIFLPPVGPRVKIAFVEDLLSNLARQEGVTIPGHISANTISDPSQSFMSKHEDALGYVVALLAKHSPRIVHRTTTALQFFYQAFRDRSGGVQKNDIRFSDIVTLEFIKIRYPFLIDFFTKTIHLLIAQTEKDNIEGYLLKRELEEKKINLAQWITNSIGRELSSSEKEDALKLVGLVMYYYFDFLQRDYDVKRKDQYMGTTSYPEIMHDYLSLLSESIETSYRRYNQIYRQHRVKESSDLLLNLENHDLVGYARFLQDVSEADQDLHIEVINELTKRLLNRDIKIELMSVGDTSFDEAIYQLVFQIISAIEKDRSKESPSQNLQFIFETLKKILSSPLINIGAKYIILNSFANNERGGGSSIHLRLEGVFEKLRQYYEPEIKKLIKTVFNDVEKRYLKGRQVIYENEENFFYVLYQGWSGSKDAEGEIGRIRNAAERGLNKYPKAIKLYWSRYPIGEGWKDLDDVLKDNPFFADRGANNDLYMPLSTLVSITKQAEIEDKEINAKVNFWGGLVNSPRLKEMLDLKNDFSTLKAVLIKRELLET